MKGFISQQRGEIVLTPKERVLAAVRHEVPDRIPIFVRHIDDPEPIVRLLGLGKGESLHERLGFDCRYLDPQSRTDSELFPGTAGWVNEAGGSHPLGEAESVEEIENYPWPSADYWDYRSITGSKQAAAQYAVLLLSAWTPVFSQLMHLFGPETLLVHLKYEPKLVEAAISCLGDYYSQFLERVLEAGEGFGDFLALGDDFATQRGLLISPHDWRRYLMPTYRRWFEMARRKGLRVWFHSCGDISEVIPDLIDIGMNVWETVQIDAASGGPEQLKKLYGHNIAFFGGLSTQRLPFLSPSETREAVRVCIRGLGKGGGYICGPDHHIKPDVPPENVVALYDEARSFRAAGYTTLEGD